MESFQGSCSLCGKETYLSECILCLRNKKVKDEKIKCSENQNQSNDLLVDKYSPDSINQIVGNKTQVLKAKTWIKNFKSKKEGTKPALLIIGSPGIGKTTLAQNLLKEYKYDLIEFNASDIRNQKLVKEHFRNIIGKVSISSMMGVKRFNGIIMDEVDGMSSGDKGGMSELISFINPNKGLRKNKRKPLSYINPIICISNEDYDKKINDLKKECEVIKFVKPKKSELYDLIQNIIQKEGKEINDEIIFKIVEHSQYDIRKLIGLLEFYLKNDNLDIKGFLESISKKNIHSNLFDSCLKVLTEKIPEKELMKIFEEYNVVLNQILHENILTNYQNYKGTENEKLNNLEKNYEAFSNADILDGKLYKDHTYEVMEYMGYVSCMTVSNNLKQMERYQYLKNHEVVYSKILSKFSIALNNFKLKTSFKRIFNNINSRSNLELLLEIFLNYFLRHSDNIEGYLTKMELDEIEKVHKIVKSSKINSIMRKDCLINELDKKDIKNYFLKKKS